ncbi:MAG: carboxypeptidase-like regulatory domain-containing protein [Nitrososphaerota archaeon]|nr:carboxypeptidase-like regulatory domain-containing protein [Nitrososphaerota archaeon]
MRMRSGTPAVLLMVLLALTLFLSVGTEEVYAGPSTNSLTITVRNQLGEPLQGANVTAYFSNGTRVLNNSTVTGSTITGTDGRASLVLKNGTSTLYNYTLRVLYKGKELNTTNVNCNASGCNPRTFEVRLPVLHLRVFVKGRSGDPVEGARVNVTSSETVPQSLAADAVTDSNGQVIVKNLPSNTPYTVSVRYEVSGPGLGTRRYTPDPISHTLQVGNDKLNVTLPLYRLQMTVRDRDGSPVAGVRVELYVRGANAPLRTTTSPGDGGVVFRLIPAETYLLRFVLGNEEVFRMDDRYVGDDTNLGDLTLPIAKLSLIANTLLGRQVSDISLTARLLIGATEYKSVTSSDGRFDFGYVRADRGYELRILFEGQEVYRATLRSENIRVDLRVTVNIGNFGVTLNLEGLFGRLPQLLRDTVLLRLSVEGGTFSREWRLERAYVLIENHPLVTYRYQLLYLGQVIGDGALRPQRNGEQISLMPSSYEVRVAANSTGGRPIDGTLVLLLGGSEVGRIEVTRAGALVGKLVDLNYEYRFLYKGIGVAEGRIDSTVLRSGILRIVSRVVDLRVRVLDYSGTNPLEGALVYLSVGEYREGRITDAEGRATFPDVPHARVAMRVVYKGVEVLSEGERSFEFSLAGPAIEVTGTKVFRVILRVQDGEGRPLGEGRYSISIAEFRSEGTLGENGSATVGMVPGGRVEVAVAYRGINVFTGRDLVVDEDGEVLSLRARVFTLQLSFTYVSQKGDRLPLKGVSVKVIAKENNAELFTGVSGDDGVVRALLPATRYDLQATYLGIPVHSSTADHSSTSRQTIDLPVYTVQFRLLNFEGRTVGNTTYAFYHVTSDASGRGMGPVAIGRSDGFGSVILPEGRYRVRFNTSFGTQEAGIEVKGGPRERVFTVIPPRSFESNVPYFVSPLLVTVGAIGLVKTLRIGGRKPENRAGVDGRRTGRSEVSRSRSTGARRVMRRNI